MILPVPIQGLQKEKGAAADVRRGQPGGGAPPPQRQHAQAARSNTGGVPSKPAHAAASSAAAATVKTEPMGAKRPREVGCFKLDPSLKATGGSSLTLT